MRKLVVSVTLDGVFDADTMGQWFRPYNCEDRQEWIKEGILASDAFLLGRTTYEMLAEQEHKATPQSHDKRRDCSSGDCPARRVARRAQEAPGDEKELTKHYDRVNASGAGFRW